MKHKYQAFKINNKTFIVKLDLNPITNDFEYHMYIRHLVTPEEAIAAYFHKSSEKYNEKYDRYELYSEKFDICVYYTFVKNKNIFIITAFYKGELNE